jgi:hypothetical protein
MNSHLVLVQVTVSPGPLAGKKNDGPHFLRRRPVKPSAADFREEYAAFKDSDAFRWSPRWSTVECCPPLRWSAASVRRHGVGPGLGFHPSRRLRRTTDDRCERRPSEDDEKKTYQCAVRASGSTTSTVTGTVAYTSTPEVASCQLSHSSRGWLASPHLVASTSRCRGEKQEK